MHSFTAADLRRNQTTCERILWEKLRARRMVGLKFRRQHPIGPFIADFVCLQLKTVIEVDGKIHDARKAYDERRDRWLRQQGFVVLRIKNEAVEAGPEEIAGRLRRYFRRRLGI